MQTCSDSIRKTKKKTYRVHFEDHVKSVEELVAFLSNHEQEALESTGKRNTNGTDMTIPRCTRQSFLIELESLTSLTNTLTEIGHSHFLDRICFESMTTLGVESVLFQIKGMRADHDMPTVAKYAYRRARYVAHLIFIRRISHFSLGPIHFIRRKLSKVNPQT